MQLPFLHRWRSWLTDLPGCLNFATILTSVAILILHVLSLLLFAISALNRITLCLLVLCARALRNVSIRTYGTTYVYSGLVKSSVISALSMIASRIQTFFSLLNRYIVRVGLCSIYDMSSPVAMFLS